MNAPVDQSPPPTPARATLTSTHRGFRISVTASRRITGALLVNAELAGGPADIRRWYCVASDKNDLVAACEQCIGELKQVIDDLSAPSEAA